MKLKKKKTQKHLDKLHLIRKIIAWLTSNQELTVV